MPGLFGFAKAGAAADDLAPARAALLHHADHTALPLHADGRVASGLVLRRAGYAGGHHLAPGGVHVWIDGEAYGENGLLLPEEAAEILARSANPAPLNGNFAAVVLDTRKNELRFITDPFGLKFLYVRAQPFPAWCGELQGFLHLPGPNPDPDPECIAQILEYGHPLGDSTNFQGIKLLRPGIVATLDLDAGIWTSSHHQVLDPHGRSAPHRDRARAVEMLGRLLRRATERRSDGPARIGVTLSGGLDSRALLAAVPASLPPPETVTFGLRGCADERIAARAAAVRGSAHTVLPLGDEGWLEERAHRVPLTDGHISILDLHGMESLPKIEARMDVCLHGFLGDALAGGSYLDRRNFSFHDQYLHRGRRFILQALHFAGTRMIYRTPFLDLDLARAVFAMPEAWLRGSRLYNDALLHEFPDYFRDIPWEKTGLPAAAPRWRILLQRALRRIRKSVSGRRSRAEASYTDYPRWLRRGSDAEYLKATLAPGAAVEAHVSRGDIDRLLREHFRGVDHSVVLGRILTLEIWFRHVRDAVARKSREPS